MRIWNETALRMSVHWYHKGHTHEEATEKLLFYARKDTDLVGRRKVRQRLSSYERWYRNSGRTTTHVRLSVPPWDPEPLPLGGYFDRVDVVLSASQQMQGIFLGRHTAQWSQELRMPLAEHALATYLGWPLGEVAVGVQLIDGSEPEVHHYSDAEVSEALEEFRELRSRVVDLVAEASESQ